MKDYYMKHVLRGLDKVFKSISCTPTERGIEFTWGTYQVDVPENILDSDSVSDADIALFVARELVDLAVTI